MWRTTQWACEKCYNVQYSLQSTVLYITTMPVCLFYTENKKLQFWMVIEDQK